MLAIFDNLLLVIRVVCAIVD